MRIALQSTKELIRHTLYKTGGTELIRAFKKIKGIPHNHLTGKTNAARFTAIYDDKVWAFVGGDGSLSGPGSNHWATRELVENLAALTATLKITRLIDIGCGDFGWMQFVQGDFQYVGIDVVQSVVSRLNEIYGSDTRTFIQADATVDTLPVGDAALCREVLFHLSFEDIWGVIANLKRHGYTYLIATSDKQTWFNANITSGDHRPLNLEKAPFRFPEPFHVFKDDKVAEDRIIGVWRLSEINPPQRTTRT
jgi:hypothetical protein